jgi:hypothetical protein
MGYALDAAENVLEEMVDMANFLDALIILNALLY